MDPDHARHFARPDQQTTLLNKELKYAWFLEVEFYCLICLVLSEVLLPLWCTFVIFFNICHLVNVLKSEEINS